MTEFHYEFKYKGAAQNCVGRDFETPGLGAGPSITSQLGGLTYPEPAAVKSPHRS